MTKVYIIMGEPKQVADDTRQQTNLHGLDERAYAHHLIDIAADMVVSVDDNRRINLFNKTAEQVYGYTAEEMLGQPITPLYDNPEEYQAIGEQMRTTGRFAGEITGRKKNGERFPVFVTAILLRNPAGEVIGSVGYSRDLTAEKKAAAVEREYIAMLGEEKLKKEVENITRHDMKSPLSSIIGFADLLLEDKTLGDEHKQLIKIIYNSGIKALRMVNLSLDLLKIEQGVYPLAPQKVRLVPILLDMLTDNATSLRTKRLSVVFLVNDVPCRAEQLPEEQGTLAVLGEEIMCYNILANLFKNAVEASPPDQPITLAVTDTPSAPDHITIAIHNMGTVPVEIRDRFFEKYATAGKRGGTGLGTYSAQLLTRTLGGRISMETAAETGTTLTVVLLKAQPGTGEERVRAPAGLENR
ncbi:MAG: PAS domain-containing sensor histidine kinase [Magnetococcales bacterium]|nr:PAS domain-containing sensor histidine kinase [Magnetococcales bacterium]